MLFYVVSLMCTVIPCAHVINSDSTTLPSSSVKSDVITTENYPSFAYETILSSSPENFTATESTQTKQKTGRAYLSSGKDKFMINQLQTPAQDEPAQWDHDTDFLGNQNPVVAIKDGLLRGFTMKSINSRPFGAFQSIPFALPPVGERRFREPEKNLPWTGVRDAIEPSPHCIQSDYIKQYMVHGQEDCLFLNVYTPSLSSPHRKKLPVMVFIHGGGFFFSSSSLYGPAYILDSDVVLVTLNYRLGSLGFLSTGDDVVPGNNGFKDQVLGLRWVQENIANFGGDPNSVTIFGESAGASSVHFHFLSPLSRGLFHRGISQSGCAMCFWSIDETPQLTAQKFGSLLNCNGTSEEMIDCLRKKDAAQLASMHPYFLEWLMYPVVVFGPVIEPKQTPGAFLSEHPEEIYKQKKAAKVPWITGYNSDEGGVNIAVLFLNNKTVPQLNTEWETYGPVFLDMKKSGENYVENVRKVRNFYLGENEISFENRKSAIDMFGDRYSISCGLKAMRYHSMHTGQPVYAYHLSYSGKYSIVQLLGQKSEDWGVSHLNDLVYQFNNTVYYPELQLEDEEYKMSRIMNNMWTNFASYGKPYMSLEGKLNDIWEPIDKSEDLQSPLKFLDLNLHPKMISDPFVDRDKFWRNLNLLD